MAHHVMLGDALRDADDQVQLSLHSFQNGLRGEWRRHVQHGRSRASLLDSFLQSMGSTWSMW